MDSREYILNSIRRHTTERYDKPDLSPLEAEAITYDGPVAQFTAAMKQQGGSVVLLQPGQTAGAAIATAFPNARRTVLAVRDLPGADELPGEVTFADDIPDARDINGADLGVAEGLMGVCENGAVWIEQNVKHRAVYLLPEALVFIVRRDALVNNMHEAYNRLGDRAPHFGAFISGPSKTADIEQALVFGAHGARDVTVLLV